VSANSPKKAQPATSSAHCLAHERVVPRERIRMFMLSEQWDWQNDACFVGFRCHDI